MLHFGNTLANPSLKENSNWGNPYFSSAAKVSDLWHAAYNSKGMNASVFNPQALVDKLTQLLPAVQNRLYGGTASAIVNNKAMAYFTRFNSPSWTGELLGYEITPSGLAKTPAVHATIKNHLDHNSRVILTKGWSKTDKGAPFRLPANFIELKTKNQLSDAAAAFLNYKVTEPEVIINYLRGDSLQEQSNNGPFRNRTSLIGDIIHSQAVYIGEPARFYPDTIAPKSYSQFKTQYASRAPLIYIGANDGMLHGFHAQTGEEKLAYIPGMHDIFSRLPNLTLPSYQHAYWVDGPLTEADVFIHNQWQTILVGTAGQGAKGIFALNVTDPSTFSEKNAQSIFLWEFTDKDDAGMGYLLTQPYITKLRYRGNEYKWAVLFGNGYQTNESALYILFIDMAQDGTWKINTDYLKIAVPSNSNQKIAGLTSIYPVDINGDFITDYIYAADLNGHIWKFDLNDANPENWKNKVNLFFTATFAEAGDQPISAPLVVTPHPLGKEKGVMVYFGTGKYLEPIDNTITHSSTQSFYGLWDKLDGSAPTKNALLKQTILNEIVQNEKVFRHVSNSAINWNNQHTGWYLDFFMNGAQSNQGEKTISRPLIHNGKVLFTTLLPNQNPCEFGGHSWLMSLNAENGGGLMEFSFDLNGDNKFDYQDKIITDNQGNNATPAGLLSPVGILATPTLFSLPNKTENMILLNGQTGITAILEKTGTLNTGRKQKKVIK